MNRRFFIRDMSALVAAALVPVPLLAAGPNNGTVLILQENFFYDQWLDDGLIDIYQAIVSVDGRALAVSVVMDDANDLNMREMVRDQTKIQAALHAKTFPKG